MKVSSSVCLKLYNSIFSKFMYLNLLFLFISSNIILHKFFLFSSSVSPSTDKHKVSKSLIFSIFFIKTLSLINFTICLPFCFPMYLIPISFFTASKCSFAYCSSVSNNP